MKNILISIIKIYRSVVSPYLTPSCRYLPTCSQYAIDAIKTWGPIKGTWLGIKRISKCHPFGGHGYDPVPKKKKKNDLFFKKCLEKKPFFYLNLKWADALPPKSY